MEPKQSFGPENSSTASAWRAVFDALPAWTFLVDDDVRIREYNVAAAPLMGPKPELTIGRRGGDLLHCIHSKEVAEGCGHAPYCSDCVIRNSVNKCFATGAVARERSRMLLRQGPNLASIFLLVTVSPVEIGRRVLALLMLEDISSMTEVESLIPICANCRKVRHGASEWRPIESHFRDRLGMEFTHGLCPECVDNFGKA